MNDRELAGFVAVLVALDGQPAPSGTSVGLTTES